MNIDDWNAIIWISNHGRGNDMQDTQFKVERILEEYDKRKTQQEIADMFNMSKKHVSWVTQENNYKYTRKITEENKKDNETIRLVNFDKDFEFLDQYLIENFKK